MILSRGNAMRSGVAAALLMGTAALILAPKGIAQQNTAPATGTVPLSEVVDKMSKESGAVVVADSSLKVNAAPLKLKTTPANLEQQIRTLVKTLPSGTVWGKLYLPAPRSGNYVGDDVAAYAYAAGQLFGPVGAPDPADTIEILGKRLPVAQAKEIAATLKLKPVYLLSNPKASRNGFLVEGPAGAPAASVTQDMAAQTALGAQPGKITRVEMGYEKGIPVFQYDITGTDGRKYEVRINGTTGDVLSHRLD